jgi:hypothetical protein
MNTNLVVVEYASNLTNLKQNQKPISWLREGKDLGISWLREGKVLWLRNFVNERERFDFCEDWEKQERKVDFGEDWEIHFGWGLRDSLWVRIDLGFCSCDRESVRGSEFWRARLEYRERRIFVTLKRILHRWNHECM